VLTEATVIPLPCIDVARQLVELLQTERCRSLGEAPIARPVGVALPVARWLIPVCLSRAIQRHD
jgi:hypothetical protein